MEHLADYFIRYVDARIEQEFAEREVGSDGYFQGSATQKRENTRIAENELRGVIKAVQIFTEHIGA